MAFYTYQACMCTAVTSLTLNNRLHVFNPHDGMELISEFYFNHRH